MIAKTLNLSRPSLLTACWNPGTSRVDLTWDTNELLGVFVEIQVSSRNKTESGDWTLAKIVTPTSATGVALQYATSEDAPFESGDTYEFRVQNYGPVAPLESGVDSEYSNVLAVAIP